jgi:hypothetical protein
MSRAVVFTNATGINCDMGVKPLPVRSLDRAARRLLIPTCGAALKRDAGQIEVVVMPDVAEEEKIQQQ